MKPHHDDQASRDSFHILLAPFAIAIPSARAAVTTATELQPEDVPIFIEATICAYPVEVENIVDSACKLAPARPDNFALIASGELPN